MDIYVMIYANLVRNRVKTIEEVPAEYRAEVQKLLSK